MKPIIRVQNISKSYRLGRREIYSTFRERIEEVVKSPLALLRGKDAKPKSETLWALKDISFDVQPGEVLGVIGRNGAGKSTLLKILSRITEPTSGVAELYGRIGSLLEVGTGFHAELTGRENIYLNGTILGMKKGEIDRRFDEIVAFAEVDRFLDTPVKHYSSGMYMRLAFSVAAHLEPEILVVDEVLAVGDSAFQRKCLGKMGEVARGGRTILFVSHNMAAVQQLTKSCVLLDAGKVLYHGPTEMALAKYLSASRASSSTIYDVRHAPRRYPELDRRVEFVKLEVVGPEVKLLAPNEPICLNLTIHGNKTVKDFRVSFTLLRVDGSPVGSAFGPCIHSIEQGEECELRLTLSDHHVAAGMYYFDLAIGKGNHLEGHNDYDVVGDVCHFEMTPREGRDGTQANWLTGWGPIVFENLQTRQSSSTANQPVGAQ